MIAMETEHLPRFAAWTYCPSCNAFDVHSLRRPYIPAATAPWERKLRPDSTPKPPTITNYPMVESHGLDALRDAKRELINRPMAFPSFLSTLELLKDLQVSTGGLVDLTAMVKRPLVEWEWEVIRTCKCGNEWGEI